jgi:hypothetical protein
MRNSGIPGFPLNIQRLQFFRHFIEIRHQVIDLTQPGTGTECPGVQIALRNFSGWTRPRLAG